MDNPESTKEVPKKVVKNDLFRHLNDYFNYASFLVLVLYFVANLISPSVGQNEFLLYLALTISVLFSSFSVALTSIYNRIDDAKNEVLEAIATNPPAEE